MIVNRYRNYRINQDISALREKICNWTETSGITLDNKNERVFTFSYSKNRYFKFPLSTVKGRVSSNTDNVCDVEIKLTISFISIFVFAAFIILAIVGNTHGNSYIVDYLEAFIGLVAVTGFIYVLDKDMKFNSKEFEQEFGINQEIMD